MGVFDLVHLHADTTSSVPELERHPEFRVARVFARILGEVLFPDAEVVTAARSTRQCAKVCMFQGDESGFVIAAVGRHAEQPINGGCEVNNGGLIYPCGRQGGAVTAHQVALHHIGYRGSTACIAGKVAPLTEEISSLPIGEIFSLHGEQLTLDAMSTVGRKGHTVH